MAMLVKVILYASIALPLQGQTVDEEIVAHGRAARAAEQRDDFQAAVREYEYLTHLLPQNAEMQSNLGVALYFNHELTRALAVFRRAMTLDSDLVAPHLFSGLAWYRLSDPDRAVPELQKAVHIGPSDVIARTWLGYAYVAQSNYELAVEEFEAAVRLDQNNVDVWYALGQTHLEIGKNATLRLLAIAPDGGRTWQLAGEQLRLKGDWQGALEDFLGASERRPDIPELRVLVAEMGGTVTAAPPMPQKESSEEDKVYRQAHEAEEEARAAFEQVVQRAPDSYRAHQIMADVFAAEQKPDEAIEEYRTVLNSKPDLPGIHEAIGNAQLRKGRLDEALNEFKAELRLQPRSASAHTNVGQVLVMMGNDEEARKMLNSALQLKRPPAEVFRLIGKLDLNRKDYRSAVAALSHYVSLRKDDSTAYYLLARAYRGMGNRESADRALVFFESTSQDAKVRNRAQKQLEALSGPKQVSEGTADSKPDVAN